MDEVKKSLRSSAEKGYIAKKDQAQYVNSIVTEIDTGQQDPGFMLNIFIRPTFQIVSNLRVGAKANYSIIMNCEFYLVLS